MANKTKFGFGSSESLERALEQGLLNARDIVLLDEDTDNPKIGWISKSGKAIILTDEKADLSEVEADVAALESAIAKKANTSDVEALESEIATKANAKEVDAKIAAAMGEHLTKKYEVTDVPEGTLVKMSENEIRIMVPTNSQWSKQNVGTGGDPNCYYMTFKTYSPENAVGYKEHLGEQVDAEILTTFSTDEYGRKYQPTWLALAKYDEATDTWNYYGANSTSNKYIGWDYQIDWYNADDVMIASDCVRINLSNEGCHSTIEPYYVSNVKSYVDTQIEDKISEVNSSYEVIEF